MSKKYDDLISKIIGEQGILEIVHENVSDVLANNKDLFTMLRRCGLGASDASVYMGVNQWNTVEDLIKQKLLAYVTEEEKAIGEKEAVRKGVDLEPLILEKFNKLMNVEVSKPTAMYKIKEHPQLTINFDGVMEMSGQLIPVEAKFVSTYANRYWDRSKCIKTLFEGTPIITGGASMVEHIEDSARLYGIPVYYYTQIQQQMLGLNAPFGYFTVIFDKGWEHGVFKIFRDLYVQNGIINESAKVWQQIETKKNK